MQSPNIRQNSEYLECVDTLQSSVPRRGNKSEPNKNEKWPNRRGKNEARIQSLIAKTRMGKRKTRQPQNIRLLHGVTTMEGTQT